MKYSLLIIIILLFVKGGMTQTCFDAYDLMFTDENDKLSYREFHKLELEFLDNLRGCDAIEFSVIDINGNEVILSELKGKVIVLNFWFTTCIPCLREIPELNKLVEDNDLDEVVFIGFARDNKNKLDEFFDRFGEFKYHVVPDSYRIADKYKVVAWPQSMVIDRDGKVYRSWAGLGDSGNLLIKEIQQSIDECLNYETSSIMK